MDELVDLSGIRRVELAGRLVRDEQLRTMCECRTDRNALLLSARELRRPRVAAVEQPDALEQPVGDPVSLRRCRPQQPQTQADELPAVSSGAKARV